LGHGQRRDFVEFSLVWFAWTVQKDRQDLPVRQSLPPAPVCLGSVKIQQIWGKALHT
jgi:hypothetical protein